MFVDSLHSEKTCKLVAWPVPVLAARRRSASLCWLQKSCPPAVPQPGYANYSQTNILSRIVSQREAEEIPLRCISSASLCETSASGAAEPLRLLSRKGFLRIGCHALPPCKPFVYGVLLLLKLHVLYLKFHVLFVLLCFWFWGKGLTPRGFCALACRAGILAVTVCRCFRLRPRSFVGSNMRPFYQLSGAFFFSRAANSPIRSGSGV